LAADTAWRRPPPGFSDLWQSTLKQRGAIYVKRLTLFNDWCVSRKVCLDTTQDVDYAACRYVTTLGKGEGTHFVAALVKAFPPLRGCLPWTTAVQRNRVATMPTEHHPPLTWRVTLGIAAVLVMFGRREDAALLMLQWRLGLRPGEGYMLIGAHFHLASDPHICSTVRLGARYGTKLKREQFARVYPGDAITVFLIGRIKACRAAHQPVGRWRTTTQQTWWMRKACVVLQLPTMWTAHSPRAGWATARHVAGQSATDLMVDGRWNSLTTLKIYLDAIGALGASDIEGIQRLEGWFDTLEQSFYVDYQRV